MERANKCLDVWNIYFTHFIYFWQWLKRCFPTHHRSFDDSWWPQNSLRIYFWWVLTGFVLLYRTPVEFTLLFRFFTAFLMVIILIPLGFSHVYYFWIGFDRIRLIKMVWKIPRWWSLWFYISIFSTTFNFNFHVVLWYCELYFGQKFSAFLFVL